MKKHWITAMCIVATAVALASSNAWATGFQIRTACTGSGQSFPASGPAIPFHTLSTTFGHWINSTTVHIDSGSLTVNAQGLICSYTLDTTATSTSVFSSDGTGANTTAWKPAATNSTNCQPAFTGHMALTSTNDGAFFVGTDPAEASSGTCVNSL